MIHIPFSTRTGDNPLVDVIERAARVANVSPFQMATLMSHFFEKLTDAVSAGVAITLPGVGQFTPWLWSPKDGSRSIVVPRFTAARAFRQQVRCCCLPVKAANVKAESYRRRNSNHVARPMTAQRSFTALSAFRDRIAAQARRIGLEANLDPSGP